MIPSPTGNLTPRQLLAGAVLWLDAQDVGLGFTTVGSAIHSWFDKSRNGHSVAANGSNYPTLYTDGNGMRWARGWSQSVWMNVTPVIPAHYDNGYTVITVVRPQALQDGSTPSSYSIAYSTGDNSTSPIHDQFFVGIDSAGRPLFAEDAGGSTNNLRGTNPYPTPGLLTQSQIAILVARREPTGPTMKLQGSGQPPITMAGLAATGVEATSTIIGNANTRFVSAACPFTGDIAEIIVFPKHLTDAQVKAIVYQLNAKYGIVQAPVAMATQGFWFDAQDSAYGLIGSISGWQDKQAIPSHPAGANGTLSAAVDSNGINWVSGFSNLSYFHWSSTPPPGIDFGVGYTILAVVDPTSLPIADGVVMGQWGGSSGHDQYTLDLLANGKVEFYESNLGASTLSVYTEDAAPLDTPAVWHVRRIPAPSPGVALMSLQQSQEAVQSYGPGLAPTAAPPGVQTGLGTWFNGLTQFFTGKVAEVLMYLFPLTDAQIAQNRAYLETKYYIRSQNLPLPGYKLWLDAQDTNNGLVGPNGVPGAAVTAWLDKSGNYNKGTAVGSPKLFVDPAGLNWVEGFTASDYIACPNIPVGLAAGYTLFMMVLPLGTPTASEGVAYGTWSNGDSGHEAQWLAVKQSTDKISAYEYVEAVGTTELLSANAAAYGLPSIWHSRHNPTGPLLDLDITGEVIQSSAGNVSGTPSGSSTLIGRWPNGAGPRPFNGRVAEVLFYPFTMTDAQVAAVRVYLKRKYAPKVLPVQGQTMWLDAQDIFNGLLGATPAATTMTTWADKAGSPRAVTATGAPTRTIDASGLIWASGFTASDHFDPSPYVPIDLTKGMTIFAAVRPKSWPGSGFAVIFGSDTTSTGTAAILLGLNSTGKADAIVGINNISNSQTTSALAVPLNTPSVIHCRHIPSSLLSVQTSGDTVQSAATTTGGSPSQGPSLVGFYSVHHAFDGDIGEIIVFPFALTDAQVTLVRNYLEAKYGI